MEERMLFIMERKIQNILEPANKKLKNTPERRIRLELIKNYFHVFE